MKRILSLYLCMFLCTVVALADNVVSLSASDGQPGDVVSITLSMSNSNDVAAAEFQIALDESLRFVDGSFQAVDSRLGTKHRVSVSEREGLLKVYIFSVRPALLPEGEGALFSFDVRLRSVPGNYELTPTVKLSDQQARSLACQVTGTTLTILAPQIELGKDTVDFGRIAIRSEYVEKLTLYNTGTEPLVINSLSTESEDFLIAPSSLTIAAGSSEEVSITCEPEIRGSIEGSLTISSNAINGTQSAVILAEPFSVNELHIGNASGPSDSEVTLSVAMNNMENIAAVQFFISLPDELEFVSNSFKTTDRSGQMTASASVSKGVLRCFLYTLSSANRIMEGNGDIASFKLRLKGMNGNYTLTPTDVILGLSITENIASDSSAGQVTIQSPTISAAENILMDPAAVKEGTESKYTIRNDGSIDLVISKVSFLADHFSIYEDLPLTIAAGKSKALTVFHSPAVAGDFSTTMQVYSNDPAMRVKSVDISGTAYAPNLLNVASVASPDNKQCIVTVGMDNYNEVVAIHANVQGLSGMQTSAANMLLRDRSSSYQYIVVKKGDGSYNVDLYSPDNTPIETGNGPLFQLIFESASSIPGLAQREVKLRDVIIGNIHSQNIASQTTATSQRHLINLVIETSDGEVRDKTRVVFNESKGTGYEADCDAPKFFSTGHPCQMYSLDKDGVKYQINERPVVDGIVPLGLVIAESDEFTISATRLDRPVCLYDKVLDIEHDLSTGGYTFSSNVGTFENRFELRAAGLSGDANGDGRISIADITAIIAHLAGNTPASFNEGLADADQDGNISTSDIDVVVTKILNK